MSQHSGDGCDAHAASCVPYLEVDTQSAVFSILTFTLHHAYPRAEESWERQICAWDTHRRAHSARKYAATRHTFLHTRQAAASRAGEPHGAAKAASDARAARPSRLIIAAVAPRRHSCHGRRLAAPRRLAAADSTSGSSERSEVSTNSARIEPPTAEETPATSAPMKVMAPVGLAGLWSRRSNAGQRQGSAAAGSAAACSDVRQGKVDAAQRAARRGEGERAPE